MGPEIYGARKTPRICAAPHGSGLTAHAAAAVFRRVRAKRRASWTSPVFPRAAANPLAEVRDVLQSLQLSPLLALAAGVLILIFPRLLNYIVAFYLIVAGLIGLGIVR